MATYKNIKPIVVLPGPGVSTLHIRAVISGIEEMLSYADLAEIESVMPIINLADQTDIEAYKTINDHIDHALLMSQRPPQLVAEALMTDLYNDSLNISPSHYLVAIISEDMYSNTFADEFILAFNKSDFATIVSRYRFADQDEIMMFEMLKFTVMHDLGHIFGLPSKSGYEYNNTEEHCQNEWCLMRQGMNLDQWRQHAFERMAALSLCPQCKEALKHFVRQ
jgi:predicted Zn-dependent protease